MSLPLAVTIRSRFTPPIVLDGAGGAGGAGQGGRGGLLGRILQLEVTAAGFSVAPYGRPDPREWIAWAALALVLLVLVLAFVLR